MGGQQVCNQGIWLPHKKDKERQQRIESDIRGGLNLRSRGGRTREGWERWWHGILCKEPNLTGSRPSDPSGLCKYVCRDFSATWHGILIRVGVARMLFPNQSVFAGRFQSDTRDSETLRDGGRWDDCHGPAGRTACERLFVQLGLELNVCIRAMA